jgi:hypothetical protein
MDQLSGRRRIARFGWINEPEQIDLTSVPLCFAHHGPGYLPLSENEKVASGVVLCMDSCELHGTGFFVGNEVESLFDS